MDSITIIQPDDWHLHFRDESMLHTTVPFTAQTFARAIVMPNLTPPITTAALALSYRGQILNAAKGYDFEPLMVLYLTDSTSPQDVIDAKNAGVVAFKLYPKGATTNSDNGVTDIKNIYPALEKMQELDMRLCIHGEVTDDHIDIFDREAIFIGEKMIPVRESFPELKIIFEHITTKDAADYVLETDNIGATVTPQHLMMNRNDLLVGGVRPHNYCLPILKRNIHQEALRKVVTEGNSKFFLGTDSAPHLQGAKESDCGCAGCFNSPNAIEMYAQVFEEMNALDKLEAFSSINGPRFYDLPYNRRTITLEKVDPYKIESPIMIKDLGLIVPFGHENKLRWRVRR